MTYTRGRDNAGAPCDQCGQWTPFLEMAETIEEYLCEECASGIEEEHDDTWGDIDEYQDDES